jgi:hypothetical protein
VRIERATQRNTRIVADDIEFGLSAKNHDTRAAAKRIDGMRQLVNRLWASSDSLRADQRHFFKDGFH